MHQPAIDIEFNSSGIYWFYFTVVITIIIIMQFRLIISVHLCTLFPLHCISYYTWSTAKGPINLSRFLAPFCPFCFCILCIHVNFFFFFCQIGPYTEDRELPSWLHCRHWPHGAVMITSLSAAGGAMAGVVAALGYRCTYVCVKNMMYATNYLCKNGK